MFFPFLVMSVSVSANAAFANPRIIRGGGFAMGHNPTGEFGRTPARRKLILPRVTFCRMIRILSAAHHCAQSPHIRYLPPPAEPLPLPLMPDDPLPPVGPDDESGIPELVPVRPLLDPVVPTGPVYIPIPGLAFSGNVPAVPFPGSMLPLVMPEPVLPLPIPPADPLPVPPGPAAPCATIVKSDIESPCALSAADA
jgi:hypothetical protein